ncbi:hypothetical protein PGT21_032620 [Puccinia graminis f. sp. tritici]|uniref:Uncharacterized protein n=1 Tax=Puccinia graminis f. sp. tritici TaxID=56615 RepID=A0A5B0QPE1_PUCGR|nr:hypothetical protein PGT21_032620 [Puccinia graminis f. sp. tritici]
MSTLELQALAAHPALKPNERGHIQALLNDIKADYENSDDEDNTGGPEVTNIQRSPATPVGEERPQTAVHSFNLPAAKSPAGPTGSESYLAPEPQAAKDNRTPNQSPSRAPRIGEFFILPNPIGAPRTTCPTFSQFSSGNTTSPVPADMNMDSHMQDGQHSENSRSTLNTLGQTTFLTRAGNEFLESIEQNHAVLNKRVLVTPASNTASTTSLTTAVLSNSSTSAPVGLHRIHPKKQSSTSHVHVRRNTAFPWYNWKGWMMIWRPKEHAWNAVVHMRMPMGVLMMSLTTRTSNHLKDKSKWFLTMVWGALLISAKGQTDPLRRPVVLRNS